IDSEVQTTFGEGKQKKLAARCLKCSVLNLCNGGCPAHQFMPVRQSEHELNYLCAGYKAFFTHIEPYMQAMGSALRQRLPASEYFRFLPDSKMKVGRNQPCPCGSGKKYKKCCGK
ncbi:MAG: SEC-C metal-binding domain-containing protein, partial [Candidatus Latescibacteria bacterium]|nr:SEC-C metal-binding domain-containing protein [Candidatus Latescibacterota bacterium]